MSALPQQPRVQKMADCIRVLAMDAVQAANSGHPGMPMGFAEAATVLFANHLKFDPTHPNWPDRDRFVLSAGHGSMIIYALLYLTGYRDMTIDSIRNFRQLGSPAAGHPEFGHATGIETTTGPLGQGVANAVGMAMAERHMAAKYGPELVNHYTYVIAGDGCLMEGISHEAISLAGHLKLNKLIVLFDDNGISIDGSTDITTSDDISSRFKASQWHVLSCDGHDMAAVDAALVQAKTVTDKPVLIRCKTIIGKGSEKVGGTAKAHGAPLGQEEIEAVRATIGWAEPSFEIPEDILTDWRNVGSRSHAEQKAWRARLSSADQKNQFKADISGDVKQAAASAIAEMKEQLREDPQKVATRVASQKTIEILFANIPSLFGGSADLTGSNNTKVAGHEIFSASHPSGSYVHYGVREHGMAAAMNGIALHGGLIPFGGTFLVFTDYCRPSIRLSALMGQRVIYVMTHDSIGLGEDGPTHQPVEHLAALRAIPNLQVFRPADIVETAEAWQLALEAIDKPSVLALSRQGLPQLRLNVDDNSGEHQDEDSRENKSARGGYILKEGSANPQVTLLATGSEVSLADEARTILEAEGITTRLVSIPCLELLLAQDEDYKTELLGPSASVVVVEAGLEMGWAALTHGQANFVGMAGFGASAPASELFAHFKITKEAVVAAAKANLA